MIIRKSFNKHSFLCCDNAQNGAEVFFFDRNYVIIVVMRH